MRRSGQVSPPAVPPSRPGGIRIWVFRGVAILAAPVLLLVLPELVLRAVGYGYPTSFFVPIAGQAAVTTNDCFGYRFFHPAMTRSPVVCRTPVAKPAGTYRIFIIGSSAARGTPDAAFGVGRCMEAMLRERYPGAAFEVINTGMAAINSHVALPIAEDCAALGGDLLVIYMGNNEVIGPYGPAAAPGARPVARALVRLGIRVRETKLGQLAADVLGARRDAPTQWSGMAMFAENRVAADDARLPDVYASFRANLEAMVDVAAGAGIPALLCTVPVNLKDCAPFASLHRAGLAEDETKRWDDAYARGEERERAGDPAGAEACYLEARAIDARYAALEFRLGRACLALGRREEARAHYLQALELDALRFRADAAINGAIREVARRRGADLVDAAEYLAAHDAAESGIVGNALLYEHVHLNFDGLYLFARAALEKIEALLPAAVKTRAAAGSGWCSRERCAELLAFTEYEALRSREEILEIVSAPPFTGQERQAETLAEYRRVVDDLRVRADGAEGARRTAESLRAALRERPDDILWAKKLAERLFAAGDHAGGIAETRRLMERVPGLAAWHAALARMLRDAGDAKGAEAEYRTAIALRPRSPDAHGARNELGRMFLERGAPAEAAGLFEAAVAYSPGSSSGYANLGGAYAALGRAADAERALRCALQFEPRNARAQFNLAAVIVKDGRVEEAQRLLRSAVETEPDFAEAHDALGRVLLVRGEPKAAASHLRVAARLKPGLPGLREALEAAERGAR
jgi:tetratricopeptide (TPR) repeat protein